MTPKPWAQRQVSTCFMRVPVEDWPAVVTGNKTQFRARPAEGSTLLSVKTPTPVVAYCVNRRGEHQHRLMVLEDHWREPLIALADHPEHLAAEGFPDYAHFRRYWKARHHGVFRGMTMVTVHQVRPWLDGDAINLGKRLLEVLYGEFL